MGKNGGKNGNGKRGPDGKFLPGHTFGRGQKGRSGRKPDEFKAMCAALASDEAVQRAVERILGDPNHPAFVQALRWASGYGYGQPTARTELTGADGGPIQTVNADELRGELARRLDRLRAANGHGGTA